MEDMDFPTPDVSVELVAPDELKARIDDGEEVTLLDVRMESDYDEWRIDGDSVESINVPYFEFLDEEIEENVLARIPNDRELVVLCAKGGSSEFVAGALKDRGYDATHLEDGMNGWARIYETVEVERYDGSGTLLQYQRPSSGCLGYFVYDDGEAAVIDPLRAFTDRYLEDAEELGVDLKYAIDTHVHADHVSGIRALAEEGVEGVIPEAAVDRGVTYADEMTLAEDGDEFLVGDATIETVFTPGHTSGMTSYLIDDSLLATGDTLFVESVARPDLEVSAARSAADGRAVKPRDDDEGAEDAARQLYETLQERVLTLPDDTLIGGAHFSDSAVPAEDGTYTAPIGDLRRKMAALTMDVGEFIELICSDVPPGPPNYEEIIATNLGRRETNDEEAFELELGPNNCAAGRESLTGD